MADENRGLAGGVAGYHLGLAQAIRRPCCNGAGQVGDAHLVAAPSQVGRDQIPGCAPDQRAMNKQQPGSHALFVSATPGQARCLPASTQVPRPAGAGAGGFSTTTQHPGRDLLEFCCDRQDDACGSDTAPRSGRPATSASAACGPSRPAQDRLGRAGPARRPRAVSGLTPEPAAARARRTAGWRRRAGSGRHPRRPPARSRRMRR
jgi:hypothetical protein